MTTASVREVQHNLAAVLERVSRGQEVAVTRRGQVIARIVPASGRVGALSWPDSAARMRRLGATAMRGMPASGLICELRGERV